jgi:uncharacterized membrane protein HdeD (DUF308 family)
MRQLWFSVLIGACCALLITLGFIPELKWARPVVLLLTGILVLVGNVWARVKGQRLPPHPRFTTGIGLLAVYYAVLAYLIKRRALSETTLEVLGLIGVVAIVIAVRYLWTASRRKRKGPE